MIKPIRNDACYAAARVRIAALWGANELDVPVDLVDHDAAQHLPVPEVEPIELIRTHTASTGRGQSILARLPGSPIRSSEVLRHRRALTVDMIHKLTAKGGIPADCRMRPMRLRTRKRTCGQVQKVFPLIGL